MNYLTFSDSAKYAQAAKNLINGHGLTISHSFFDVNKLVSFSPGVYWNAGFLPFPAWILSFVFRFFPATDNTVVATGLTVYFLLLLGVFFLSKKLFGSFSGIISVLLTLSSLYFWEYATNSSSEIFFAAQIIWLVYFWLLGKPYRLLALITAILMLFTRQQSFVVIVAFFVAAQYLTLFKKDKQYKKTSLLILLGLIVFLVIGRLDVSSKFSPFRTMYLALMQDSVNPSFYLRGVDLHFNVSPLDLAIKVFYNTYNFLKDPSRITSPIIISLFILYAPIKTNKDQVFFKVFSLSLFLLLIAAASLSLPNARYIHPINPLLAVGAGALIAKSFKENKILSSLLMLLIVLPFFGHITIDQRFYSKQYNLSEPPASKVISDDLAKYIPKDKLVITNLDAWPAWYQDLTTMWFPISPSQLEGYQNDIDYIVLTDYNTQNEDFSLGEWLTIFDSPESIPDVYSLKQFKLFKEIIIDKQSVRENQQYKVVIFRRS